MYSLVHLAIERIGIYFLLGIAGFNPVHGGDTPITALPLYTRANQDVQYCITSVSPVFTKSYGCTEVDPATCLCVNPTSSYVVASNLRSCILGIDATSSHVTIVTQLWSSYCSINAGVSAKDEILLQDIPLWTQFTAGPACASRATSSYSISWGCDIVTPASCLCADETSSSLIASSMLSCVFEDAVPSSQQSSVTLLWSSYCSLNLKSPATRSAPNIVAATTTSSKTSTSQTGVTSSGGGISHTGGSSTSGDSGGNSNSTRFTVVTTVLSTIAGLLGLVVMVAIWWCTRRDNREDSQKLWNSFKEHVGQLGSSTNVVNNHHYYGFFHFGRSGPRSEVGEIHEVFPEQRGGIEPPPVRQIGV